MLPVWNHWGLGRLGPVLRCFAVRAALAWMNFRPPGRQLSVETVASLSGQQPRWGVLGLGSMACTEVSPRLRRRGRRASLVPGAHESPKGADRPAQG